MGIPFIHLILVLSTVLVTLPARATMTLQVLSGGSRITYPTDPDTGAALKPVVYAGRAGPECPTSAGAYCDSCALTSATGERLFPCNHTSIVPSGELHIELTTDTSTTYGPTDITAFVSGGTGSITVGTSTYNASTKYLIINIPWSNLCSALGADSSCIGSSGGVKTVSVGLGTNGSAPAEKYDLQVVVSGIADDTTYQYSTNCGADGSITDTGAAFNYGYCYFKATRGDGKVYIDPLVPAETYPTFVNGVTYNGIEVFYASGAEGDETNILNSITAQSPSQSFELVSGNAISDNRVTGLANDERYCFVVANKDVTGNILLFTAPPGVTPPGSTPAETAAEMCTTPSLVAGLLDDKHCFIATAAFGSDMAPEVKTFRAFRNKFLLGNSWGRQFVKTYYDLSPPLAQFISEHPTLRAATRGALWPLLFFAKLSLQWGIIGVALVMAILVFAAMEGIRRLFPRGSRKIS